MLLKAAHMHIYHQGKHNAMVSGWSIEIYRKTVMQKSAESNIEI